MASSPRSPLKHPTIRFLVALVPFIRRYLFIGAPFRPFALDDQFRPLHGIADADVLERESYVATILCAVLPYFLKMASLMRRRHRPAAGGWAHPNLFSPHDLPQAPFTRADLLTLKRTSSAALCRLLQAELRLLLRLLRAAQRDYWYRYQTDEWQRCHQAAMQVLVRIIHICARLRKRGTASFAEQCLRQELFTLWRDQFGPAASLPDAAYVWMEPTGSAPAIERRILIRLLWERAQWQADIPPAYTWLVARWEQGREYPDVYLPGTRPRPSAVSSLSSSGGRKSG